MGDLACSLRIGNFLIFGLIILCTVPSQNWSLTLCQNMIMVATKIYLIVYDKLSVEWKMYSWSNYCFLHWKHCFRTLIFIFTDALANGDKKINVHYFSSNAFPNDRQLDWLYGECDVSIMNKCNSCAKCKLDNVSTKTAAPPQPQKVIIFNKTQCSTDNGKYRKLSLTVVHWAYQAYQLY